MATPAVIPDSATGTTADIPKGSDYQNWRKTGELKAEPEEQPKPADPASASENASASEAEPQQEIHSKPKSQNTRRSNAESRLPELLEEIKSLRAQLGQQRQSEPTKAEPSPAKAESAPVKPKIADFKTLEEYEDARDKYYDELADFKASQAVKKYESERVQKEGFRQMQEKLAESRERYSDFDEVAEPARKGIFDDPQIPPVVKAYADRSKVFTDLLYVIGGDKGEMSTLLSLAKTDPLEAIGRMRDLERLIIEELSGQATKEPPAKRVTSAPPPPVEVGGRNSAPHDPVQEAAEKAAKGGVTAGVRDYMNAANQKQLASRRRG